MLQIQSVTAPTATVHARTHVQQGHKHTLNTLTGGPRVCTSSLADSWRRPLCPQLMNEDIGAAVTPLCCYSVV